MSTVATLIARFFGRRVGIELGMFLRAGVLPGEEAAGLDPPYLVILGIGAWGALISESLPFRLLPVPYG